MDCSKCAWGTDREACRACKAEEAEGLSDMKRRLQDGLNRILGGKDVLEQAEEILEQSHYYRPDPRD